MAAEGDVKHEIVSHRKSYESFITMMKWGGALSLLTAMLWIFIVGL